MNLSESSQCCVVCGTKECQNALESNAEVYKMSESQYPLRSHEVAGTRCALTTQVLLTTNCPPKWSQRGNRVRAF